MVSELNIFLGFYSPAFLFAPDVTTIVVLRYLYYYYNLKDPANISNLLVWLRYSLFIVLYPR